jgi:CelD/BcsL family acetyltransferase involved in cellulose biosynthesis
MSFALLLGTVKDGQTLRRVSCLGGTTIMARLEAIEQISGHTRLYWTGARLSDLSGLVAERKNPDEVARFFHITVEEVQNGWTKLFARFRRVA